TPVEAFRPELPPEVAAALRRLMARDPAQRYPAPAEAASALAPFSVAGAGDLASAGDTVEYCANTDGTHPSTVPVPAQPGEPARAEETEFEVDGEPAPLSLEEDLAPLVRERDRERRRGIWKRVFWTAGAVSGLAGLVTLAVLFG